MKKILLTESEKKAIIVERENTIISSFNKIFNSIKRIDENELALHNGNDIARNSDGVMNLYDFIKITSKTINGISNIRPKVHCKDGFSVSVQANRGHYSTPRQDNLPFYSAVEVGYPSEIDQELNSVGTNEWSGGNELEKVWPYMDVNFISKIIDKHGGIDVNKTIHGWVKSRNGYTNKNNGENDDLTGIDEDIVDEGLWHKGFEDLLAYADVIKKYLYFSLDIERTKIYNVNVEQLGKLASIKLKSHFGNDVIETIITRYKNKLGDKIYSFDVIKNGTERFKAKTFGDTQRLYKEFANQLNNVSVDGELDEASVDQTGGIHGLSGDFIDDDLPQYLDQFDTSSGMMDLKDLEATRNKGYQRNPYAAEIADFANQYNKKLRILYKAYNMTHDKISYAQFVRAVHNGHQELVTEPINPGPINLGGGKREFSLNEDESFDLYKTPDYLK